MQIPDIRASLDTKAAGAWMHERVCAWYPICRSITGDGVRETLRSIGEHIPLRVHEVPTGTAVFDWTIPKEWNIRDAYVKDAAGKRVVDFQQCNLHVLGYSVPVQVRMPGADLKEHCFTLPEHPEWVPYRTSYFKEQWGFCLSQQQADALTDAEYEVCVDSSLESGHLTYGEYVLPGATEAEVLISAHVCHPSLANDNLSSIALAVWLARAITPLERRYTYRFVFAPGTIGAITWLARNDARLASLKHGLVLACVGDPALPKYKQSRQGGAEIDHAVEHVLARSGVAYEILPFSPYGYDERQYCSPGIDLPVGCFMRGGPAGYPEYHSSADNPDLVRPECLADSLARILDILTVLEGNATYQNLSPKCEPQLGRRGLYAAVGGQTGTKQIEMAMLWVLNYSDGKHSLLDISSKANLDFSAIRAAADALLAAKLLAECAE